jgi:hypothetical protein
MLYSIECEYVYYAMGRLWTEVVANYFKVLFQNFPGKTEENEEKPVRLSGTWTS